MNKSQHRLIFNQSRGCMMAVLETASSGSKSSSGESKARRRASKRCKTVKTGRFRVSNVPPAQWIRAQTAIENIVFSRYSSDTARGSSIAAGNNINIKATALRQAQDARGDGNILIQGSSVKAGNNATLIADNQVNLLAARNESSQSSTNSNSSSSIGASFSAKGISANASVSRGSGRSDGQDTSFTNTQVQAGNTATIKSGGDTNVIGAVVAANQIKAEIGGNLNIQSLQDKSSYTSGQSSRGASISVPITGAGSLGGSVSASKSNINSNFASVNEKVA